MSELQSVYCLTWKSPSMPGVAFWYYRTRAQAEEDALIMLRGGNQVQLRKASVPKGTPMVPAKQSLFELKA